MLKIAQITDKSQWDDFINRSGGHPLQLWGWGELKEGHNWQAHRLFIKEISADADVNDKESGSIVGAIQILTRKLPWPLKSFAYAPRGPVILSHKPEEQTKILTAITDYCKHKLSPRPVCLSIEPDWEDFPETSLANSKWRQAKNTILIPKTLIVDLSKDDDELLAEMSKKTRQYIRKSSSSISVREIENEEELEKCLDIYEETANRAGFAIHGRDYYKDLWRDLGENSPIFAAFTEVEEGTKPQGFSEDKDKKIIHEHYGSKAFKNTELVAFLWLAKSDRTSFELYGGVNELGQKTRANFILKWLTMKQMQSQGVIRYDMNGLLNDGISNFKRGFAKHEDMLPGTYDYPISKTYFIWANFLPTMKKIVRKFKK